MALTTSANFVKYLLFLFNFLFAITGVIILAVGLTVQGAYHSFKDILDAQFFTVPTFLVVIGSFIFVIAFFGCCGAYKENYCMTLTFSVLLVLIFILELAAGISGYVLRNDTRDLVYKTLNGTMSNYGTESHKDVTLIWDEIQVDFDCCGVSSYTDWAVANNTRFNETYVPMSCCKTEPGAIGVVTCPDKDNANSLRKTGCVDSFGDFVKAHAVSLGIVGITLAVIQFFGIFFACYLARQIKTQQGFTSY